MQITFSTSKLEKTFNTENALVKRYGSRMKIVIVNRMAVLDTASNLALVPTTPPERMHQLVGQLKGKFAVDLVHPFRLIFEPNHELLPRKDDGGIDTQKVVAITILEVKDYH